MTKQQKRALNVRELPTVLQPKKAKTVLESLQMVNNEKEEVQNEVSS